MQLRLLAVVSASKTQDKAYKELVVNSVRSSLPQALCDKGDDLLATPFIAETINYANEDNLLKLTLVANDQLIKSFPAGEMLAWIEAELTPKPTQASQLVWQKTLQLLNWLQFMPLFYAGTKTATQQGHYGQLNWSLNENPIVSPNEWDVIYQFADSLVHALLDKLSSHNIQPPTVAFELTVNGRIVAEAELAWEANKIAFLMDYQIEESATQFFEQGWQVFTVETPEEQWIKTLGVQA
jgi:DEAD/DEAH box helicase domain-containing protein